MNSLFSGGEHAIYLVCAFGFSTVILILNLWMPLHKYRQIIHRFKKDEPIS